VCVPAYTGFAYDVIDKADIHMQKISQLLRDKSVVLRIQAGSQDAGFLSAFCPINEAPALVLIQYVRRNRKRNGDWLTAV
jgi:hypothetical protein